MPNHLQSAYITDNNGRHKITTLSYSYDAQIIGEKLFYVDDGLLSGYEFFEYDLKTKKTRKIATLNAKWIYNYYFLHDALYIEIGDDDSLIKDIVAMNLKTGEQITIAKNISACGIANNQLNYITEKDSNCSIYEYDIDNNKSLLLGEFELSYNIFQDALVGVNFNPEYVAFADDKIYVYRYGDGTLSSYDFDGKINEFISYDKFAFFSANGNIYRFNFDDNSIETIAKSSTEDSYLFVGSDDEVYISFMELGGIRRYYVNGEYEDVILNR